MSLTIQGLGTALPPQRIAQGDAATIAAQVALPNQVPSPGQRRLLDTLHRRSGVATRHSVLLDPPGNDPRQTFFGATSPGTGERMRRYAREAPPLALRAVEGALAQARVSPERITHLITISCSGFAAPGIDLALMAALPMDAGLARTHVGFMGCHGALNGLRVAAGFTAAEPGACVLLCAVELCSLHLQYGWDAERIVANALFADGAAALVATGEARAEGGPAAEPLGRLIASGSLVVPGSTDAMSWEIGDHGFAMGLSPQVPDLISEHLRPWLEGWLASHHLTCAAIGSWAVHPGGPRILSAVTQGLGLDPRLIEPSRSVLRDYGNMSSPTLLFILERLRRCGAPGPCLAMAFGPGLCIEVALLE
ncbi:MULTISPECIES: type III polyketide synthase [unclassified Cyanobium]|uniref:type III polyketide synthase n=1 Tax=unclassified Cyanobium TaxID=2627006 RepID=UPI0020CBFC66|nr:MULTISPECIES: type III polyketide synthase [unclassified Cyanobium]MCP9833102.1 type III polyketide synthase [Cyanobium sp. La Preciosa 7G6]MCP9936035.1 type III polyketide synthase [Cyanobium sp. Aljojuca 7A6]